MRWWQAEKSIWSLPHVVQPSGSKAASTLNLTHYYPSNVSSLPTPKGKDRDEREYVISQYSTTGGIQRFKQGHHGAAHPLCAMIAYVQDNSRSHWSTTVSQWISDLAQSGQSGWSNSDVLQITSEDDDRQITMLSSTHTRSNGLPDIAMRHLWVQMN